MVLSEMSYMYVSKEVATLRIRHDMELVKIAGRYGAAPSEAETLIRPLDLTCFCHVVLATLVRR